MRSNEHEVIDYLLLLARHAVLHGQERVLIPTLWRKDPPQKKVLLCLWHGPEGEPVEVIRRKINDTTIWTVIASYDSVTVLRWCQQKMKTYCQTVTDVAIPV